MCMDVCLYVVNVLLLIIFGMMLQRSSRHKKKKNHHAHHALIKDARNNRNINSASRMRFSDTLCWVSLLIYREEL